MIGLIVWNENLNGYDLYKCNNSSLIYPSKNYVGNYETLSDVFKICIIFKFDEIDVKFENFYPTPTRNKLIAHVIYLEFIQEWRLEISELIHVYDSSLYGIIDYALTNKISAIYINLTNVKERLHETI